NTKQGLSITGQQWGKDVTLTMEQNTVVAQHTSGETVTITFTPDIDLTLQGNNYVALAQPSTSPLNIALSFYANEKEM
ncbi:glycoside hydrolase family 63 protein, partial [gut metagenome]